MSHHTDALENARIRRFLADAMERTIERGGAYEEFDRKVVAKLREDAAALEGRGKRRSADKATHEPRAASDRTVMDRKNLRERERYALRKAGVLPKRPSDRRAG
jgi:hypothetical protein